MHPVLATVFTLFGCCANVVCLEFLTRELPGCGNIVTCFQFIFIALHGFIWTMRCGREPSRIPIRAYFVMVSLFFIVSVLNNYALNFGIPMPLHMIFKGGSLVANMAMGMWVLGRFYPRFKYLAVAIITVGIVLCTYSSRVVKSDEAAAAADAAAARQQGRLVTPAAAPPEVLEAGQDGLDRTSGAVMAVGVSILLVALLLSARLGIFQEVLYRDHGRHSQQALFFTHALPLPAFLLLTTDIMHQAALFSVSTPVAVPLVHVVVPKMWFYLAVNVLTQYVCISSVFRLTETCTSLTVTLIITLRKFVSLMFSIWYFSNPFLTGHWVGSALVFAGTLAFTDPFGWFSPAAKNLPAKQGGVTKSSSHGANQKNV